MSPYYKLLLAIALLSIASIYVYLYFKSSHNYLLWNISLGIAGLIFLGVELKHYHSSGLSLKINSSSFEQVLAGYRLQEVVYKAEKRIAKDRIGGRNAFYGSNEDIYRLARSKTKSKLRAVNLFRESHIDLQGCVNKMVLKESYARLNCVEAIFRGENKGIVCMLLETQAIRTDQFMECHITGKASWGYSLSAWYKDLDIP